MQIEVVPPVGPRAEAPRHAAHVENIKTGRICMISIDMRTTGENLFYSATIETTYGSGVINNG